MAIRQNKLSLEEIGGLLVDIVRPVATTSVIIRGGTLLIKDVITEIAQTTLDLNTVASGLTATQYYKVLVFYNQATSLFSARFSTTGHVLIANAFADSTITVGIREIPIAFVITQATSLTTVAAVSHPDNIVDLRGVNNAVRNIEQVRTYVASPLNKIPVADANGNFTPTRDLDINSLDIDTTLTVGTTATVGGIVRINDTTNATDSTGDTGSFGTDGGASIEKDLHIGGFQRIDNTTDATDYSGDTGSFGTDGGVSVAKNILVGQGVLEQSQITIGDGVTTFGHFNAVANNIAAALNSAITAVGSSGGKIYVKRGDYTLDATVDINGASESNIAVVGEGSGTNINIDAASFRLRVGNASLTNRVSFENIRFTSTVGGGGTTNPMIELVNATSQDCIVNKCWFVGSGNPDVDITFTQADGHLVADCRSSTTTTNLP